LPPISVIEYLISADIEFRYNNCIFLVHTSNTLMLCSY